MVRLGQDYLPIERLPPSPSFAARGEVREVGLEDATLQVAQVAPKRSKLGG